MRGLLAGGVTALILGEALVIICLAFKGAKRNIILAVKIAAEMILMIVLWGKMGFLSGKVIYMVDWQFIITGILFILGILIGVGLTAIVTAKSVDKAYKEGYEQGKAGNS